MYGALNPAEINESKGLFMNDYFKRQIQLWGDEAQKKLKSKRVLIVGAGGLGSSLAFGLGSSGIGQIHIVDFDEVSYHNIHRQLAFKLGDDGKNKALLNASLMKQRNPYVEVTAHECNFQEWTTKEIEVDLIVDATDNLPVRADINRYAKKVGLPWIYGSVEAFHGQVAFIERASFDDIFKITQITPQGIAAPMVMHIASLQANLALRFLVGLSVKKDMLYYLFFNNEGEIITQKFNLPV